MTNKITELDYDASLDKKIISKIGNPFKLSDETQQRIMNKFYETDEVIVGKKILVIRMMDIAEKYALNNSVVYITDNKEKYDEFLKLINEDKYGGDDEAFLFDDWKNINKFIENSNMPKFDIIIGNPPYGDNSGNGLSKTLHFDITACLIDSYIEKMIFIMPHKIVFSTTKKFDKFKKCVDSKIKEICDAGNPFNDVKTAVGIFTFVKNNNSIIRVIDKIYTSLFDINPFTEYENKYMSKLKNFNFAKNFYKLWPTVNNTKAYCRLTGIANGAKNGTWFSSKIKNCEIFDKDKLNEWNNTHDVRYASITSDNKTELENIECAMKRPLLRFGLYKVQDDQNMKIRVYEYIPNIDWSDERTNTDEGILEMAGFSKKESKEFAEYVKNYMKEVDDKFNNRPKRSAKSKNNFL